MKITVIQETVSDKAAAAPATKVITTPTPAKSTSEPTSSPSPNKVKTPKRRVFLKKDQLFTTQQQQPKLALVVIPAKKEEEEASPLKRVEKKKLDDQILRIAEPISSASNSNADLNEDDGDILDVNVDERLLLQC